MGLWAWAHSTCMGGLLPSFAKWQFYVMSDVALQWFSTKKMCVYLWICRYLEAMAHSHDGKLEGGLPSSNALMGQPFLEKIINKRYFTLKEACIQAKAHSKAYYHIWMLKGQRKDVDPCMLMHE